MKVLKLHRFISQNNYQPHWNQLRSPLCPTGKHLLSPFTPVSFVKAPGRTENLLWPGRVGLRGWPLTWFTLNTYVHADVPTDFCTVEETTSDQLLFLCGSVWAGGGGGRLTGQTPRNDQSILWDSGVKVIIYELVYLVALQPAVCYHVLAALPNKGSLWVTGQNSHCSLLV